MERMEKQEKLALALLFLIIGGLLSYLPFSGQKSFLSPDESGVFNAAQQWVQTGSIAVADKLATDIPWLHPRSWISYGPEIVPVGFLGWPWILTWFIRFIGYFASIAAMIVILSSIYPFYRLLRPLGKVNAIIGTVVAYTAPAIILYGNRSLFPNGGFISLAIWSAWIFRDVILFKPREYQLVIFGLLSGLMMAIRPVEMFWLLPWFVFLGWNWRPTLKQAGWVLLGLLIALIPIIGEAQMVYGGFWKAGYWLKGNVVSTAGNIQQNSVTPELFPFGIHPKNIAYNAWTFLIGPLFPWLLPLLMIGFLVISTAAKRKWDFRSLGKIGIIFALGSWTFLSLAIYYGNGKYLDNINGLATIGNSYIRYLMPIGFLAGLAMAYLYRIASIAKYGKQINGVMVVILAFTGIWRAYAADAEGLITDKQVLIRYSEIHDATAQWFKKGDIILSERSDKIFFPEYRGVSPLPDMEQAAQLSKATEQGIQVGLFARPLGQSQSDAWRKVGLEPIQLGSFGREILYRLQPIKP